MANAYVSINRSPVRRLLSSNARLLLLACLAVGTTMSIGCAQQTGRVVPAPSDARQVASLLHDDSRGRDVPVEIYLPAPTSTCAAAPCPVALISGGYGVAHTAYRFLADALTARGYLVASVQHDLPTDVPLATQGNLLALRLPLWARGAENLRFARTALSTRYPRFDWAQVLLVGASNGGDISTLLTHERPDLVSALITLDHRRLPLPRVASPPILSVRASDFEADPGVLPSAEERLAHGITIDTIPSARHNDMQDGGSDALKRSVLDRVEAFLDGHAGSGASGGR